MAPAVARSGSTLLDRNLVALRSTIKEIGYPLRGQGVSSEAERMINDATGTLVKRLENDCPAHLHNRLRDRVQTLANASSLAQMNKSDWDLRPALGSDVWSLDLGSYLRLYFRWDSNTGYATRIYVL